MNKWYWIAQACGILPLITGTGIFTAWVLLHHDWLLYAGVLAVPGLLLLILLGFFAIGVFIRRARNGKQPYIGRSLLATLIILLNFPAGVGFAYLALEIKTTYVVTIENSSRQEINAIMIIDPSGKEFLAPALLPQEQAQHNLHFDGEGQVKFQYQFANTIKSDILFGYITSNMGGQAHVIIDSSGGATVTEK